MARNLAHSLAEKLWQTSPPRNHMPARYGSYFQLNATFRSKKTSNSFLI